MADNSKYAPLDQHVDGLSAMVPDQVKKGLDVRREGYSAIGV